MLSGGELQRFAIGIVAVQDADVYMFDEPSSYLDVKQRLKVPTPCRTDPNAFLCWASTAELGWLMCRLVALHWSQASLVIRTLLEREGLKYIIVVEHDLSILDYLSDFICVLYGVPSAYGVVTMPFNVRDGEFCSPCSDSCSRFVFDCVLGASQLTRTCVSTCIAIDGHRYQHFPGGLCAHGEHAFPR
jgi:hypothetical protein